MKKAFTLIEMMIVIAILAILASCLIVIIGMVERNKQIFKTDILTQHLKSTLDRTDSLPPSTHVSKGGPVDPEKGLHPQNCDSLLRYLNPIQAKSKGYNDPRALGKIENNINIPEQDLEKRFGNKWVVVDAWHRPVIYINDGTSFKLYSVGPNGKDDSGRGDDIPQAK